MLEDWLSNYQQPKTVLCCRHLKHCQTQKVVLQTEVVVVVGCILFVYCQNSIVLAFLPAIGEILVKSIPLVVPLNTATFPPKLQSLGASS